MVLWLKIVFVRFICGSGINYIGVRFSKMFGCCFGDFRRLWYGVMVKSCVELKINLINFGFY